MSRGIPKGYAARDAVEVRSDAMIWAEQEAKRKAAEDAAKSKANAEDPSRFLAALIGAGFMIRAFSEEKASLENAYLHLAEAEKGKVAI